MLKPNGNYQILSLSMAKSPTIHAIYTTTEAVALLYQSNAYLWTLAKQLIYSSKEQSHVVLAMTMTSHKCAYSTKKVVTLLLIIEHS